MSAGSVRVNSVHVKKPSATISAGDTLTFAQGRDIRVIRIVALGQRRGPAPEAQELYEDLAPPQPSDAPSEPKHPEALREGRPSKKDRRQIAALKRTDM